MATITDQIKEQMSAFDTKAQAGEAIRWRICSSWMSRIYTTEVLLRALKGERDRMFHSVQQQRIAAEQRERDRLHNRETQPGIRRRTLHSLHGGKQMNAKIMYIHVEGQSAELQAAMSGILKLAFGEAVVASPRKFASISPVVRPGAGRRRREQAERLSWRNTAHIIHGRPCRGTNNRNKKR